MGPPSGVTNGTGERAVECADVAGIIVGIDVAGGVGLVETALKGRFVAEQLERVIGERSYDTDKLAAGPCGA